MLSERGLGLGAASSERKVRKFQFEADTFEVNIGFMDLSI